MSEELASQAEQMQETISFFSFGKEGVALRATKKADIRHPVVAHASAIHVASNAHAHAATAHPGPAAGDEQRGIVLDLDGDAKGAGDELDNQFKTF